MTPFETVRLAASALYDGQSTRFKCPWCHGGQGGEESFIVSKYGFTAKYVCHRASCGGPSRGHLSISGKPTIMPHVKALPKPREFDQSTFKTSLYIKKSLESKYQITPEAIDFYGIKQTAANDIVIPIYSDVGTQQGILVRLDKIEKTKALTYHGADSDGLAWFTGQPDYHISDTLLHGAILFEEYINDALVLVEDVYSAIKANYFMDSIALLGVNLNSEQAAKIAYKDYKKVLLALDADATSNAVRLVRRLKVILPQLRVVILKRDLKDMPFNELGTFLSENYRRI